MIKFLQIYHDSIKKLESHSPSPELDARILVSFALKKDFSKLIADNNEVDINQQKQIEKLIEKRRRGEPVAYLINNKEFYGLDFFVDKNVLIPRPESEWLVEKSIELIKCHSEPKGEESKTGSCSADKRLLVNTQDDKLNIIDMGTGCGNIVISIAKNYSNADFYAVDISAKALNIAQKNARYHSIDNIQFIQSDLFNNIDPKIKFDIIIANLPYVPICHSERSEESRSFVRSAPQDDISFEPFNAIFSADNGTAIIKRFLTQTVNRTNPGGWLLVELDPRNAKNIKKFAAKLYPDSQVELQKDLAGFERYLVITR